MSKELSHWCWQFQGRSITEGKVTTANVENETEAEEKKERETVVVARGLTTVVVGAVTLAWRAARRRFAESQGLRESLSVCVHVSVSDLSRPPMGSVPPAGIPAGTRGRSEEPVNRNTENN
jgi:hypothetical protein